MFATLLRFAELGRLPDWMIRRGIHRLLNERLRQLLPVDQRQEEIRRFLDICNGGPVAVVPERANAQHYEVPSDFFVHALGARLKYSCSYWGPGVENLNQAEVAALQMTCERAGLTDGSQILELGCGWGSLTLWMAEHYPNSRITAVSNSQSQRRFIEQQAQSRGLTNIRVITEDMNQFDPARHHLPPAVAGQSVLTASDNLLFDHVVSVEMFEHLRNHREFLRRISTWLRPGGTLFIHIFCHRSQPYFFEETGPSDWMTRHFFAGGMMPHDSLLLHHQQELVLRDQWCWSGRHYAETSKAWLRNLDLHRHDVDATFRSVYGEEAALWRQRWRMFFMACAELFGKNDGNEWYVSHYLFENRK